MTRILFGLALALFVGAGVVLWAHPAQAEVTISVSPSLVEFKAVPGNTGEQQITVFNDGDEPFGVTVSVREYGGAPQKLSAKDFIEVSPKTFDLGPGESQSVRVSIDVPANTPSGGRYATVTFRTDAKQGGAAGTGVSGEIGVPQLFTIKGVGPIEREAKIDRILPVLMEDGTIGFQLVVDNPGNIHFFPQGSLDATCGGAPTETLQIPRGTAVVPGTERFVSVDGSLDIPPGTTCDVHAKLDYGKRRPETGRLSFNRDQLFAKDQLTFTSNAQLSITELGATEQPGSGPELRAVLDNSGELLLNPQVRLDVFDSQGKHLGSATPARPPSVEPGEEHEIKTEYPGRLGPGKYILRASAVYGEKIAQRQTTFRLGAAAPEARRPGAPEIDSGLRWWIGLGIALVSLALLGVTIRYVPQLRPLRRRLRRAWKALKESE
jgi:P pilus assembly chaperone PapD